MTLTTKRSVFDEIHDLKALRQEVLLQAHLLKAEAQDKLEVLEKRWREFHRIIGELEVRSASATLRELDEQYRLLKKDFAPRK